MESRLNVDIPLVYRQRISCSLYLREVQRHKQAGFSIMRITAEERFWKKVDIKGSDECWPWIARKDSRGYGRFFIYGREILAARCALYFSDTDGIYASRVSRPHRRHGPVGIVSSQHSREVWCPSAPSS